MQQGLTAAGNPPRTAQDTSQNSSSREAWDRYLFHSNISWAEGCPLGPGTLPYFPDLRQLPGRSSESGQLRSTGTGDNAASSEGVAPCSSSCCSTAAEGVRHSKKAWPPHLPNLISVPQKRLDPPARLPLHYIAAVLEVTSGKNRGVPVLGHSETISHHSLH